jgi:ligand-binding sensor domain-containing protein/anti-sigma regulatory factor (Ser/Thr protein kinase)
MALIRDGPIRCGGADLPNDAREARAPAAAALRNVRLFMFETLFDYKPELVRAGLKSHIKAILTKRTAVCVLLALGCAAASYALDPTKTLTQYSHRIWDQEEGIVEPTVYALLQSQDGYLWLGTQSGIVRFDGERFRPIKISSDGEPILIRSLYEDANHTLWAGSVGSGLLRISRSGKKWFTQRDGLPSDIVTCVVPHGGNALWVCTNQGLADFRSGRVKTYTVADGLPSNRVSDVCQARDGVEWVSTFDGGLARLEGGRFSLFTNQNAGLAGGIRVLHCAQDGSVWAGSDHGLFQITGSRVRRFAESDGLPDEDVLSLTQSSGGGIIVGTQTGIARFQDGEWNVYTTDDGLSHRTVFSLLLDREGSLWAGTKNGLDEFTDARVTPYTTAEGLPTNDIGPVAEDRAGTLWIGTRDRGLIRFDGHRFSGLTKANGLLDSHVFSLLPLSDGDLLAGTEKGINRIHNGRVTARYSVWASGPDKPVNSLFEDSEGLVWVGAGKGLFLLKHGALVRADEFRQSSEEQIVFLGGGHLTRLFVSTTSGRLYYWRDGKVTTYSQSDPARAIASYFYDAQRHSIWMGTLGSGLLRLKEGNLTRVRVKDGLFDDQIYAILPDDHDNLWFASSKGIFRVSSRVLDEFAEGKQRRVESIPFSTGQVRFECQSGVDPAAWRTHDGRLWFSTTNGLVVVDPNRLAPNTLPPPTQIEALFVNGQRREADKALTLAPSEKNLEIRYAGLSFVTPEKVTFRYILDGYDREWVEAGPRREAFYTNLPPGHFRFRVIACNSDGVWSTAGAALDFTIEPRLYQRRWFFPLVGALIALAIWLGFQIRVRHLKRQFDLVLSERTRIARELHDTLLQGLSGITMQLQALWTRIPPSHERTTLQDIIKDAGICLSEARQSLWGLRAAASPEGLSEKLARQARQAVAGTPVKLVLQLTPTPVSLPPEIEYQLLRIAQEAVSNSVRHAKPKSIEIRLHLVENTLELEIQDDGVGFSTDAQLKDVGQSNGTGPRAGHYGLLGMQERAGEIGATLMITSMRGAGTTVAVKLGKQGQPTASKKGGELREWRRG